MEKKSGYAVLQVNSPSCLYGFCLGGNCKLFKDLFTWRDGALASQATQLEGVKHNLPLPATHLPRTVSGLCELSFEWPLEAQQT